MKLLEWSDNKEHKNKMKTGKRQRILEDEVELVKTAIKSTLRCPVLLDKHNAQKKEVFYSSAVIISDGSRPGMLAAQAFSVSQKYADGVTFCDLSFQDKIVSLIEKLVNRTVVYAFIDTERFDFSARVFSVLTDVFLAAKHKTDIRFVISIVVPEPQGLPEGVGSVAEREYDYILERKMSGPMRDYALELHRCCRGAVRDHGLSLTVLRHVNVFGPLADGHFAEKVSLIIEEAFKNRQVTIESEDHLDVFNVSFVSDIVSSAFWSVCNAVPGHEFNVVSSRLTLAELKRIIFNSFPEELALKEICQAGLSRASHCLNNLKFEGTRWRRIQKGKLALESAISRMVCHQQGLTFTYPENTSVYDGRLPQIKAAEMVILREIDALCRKHGINYFLAGGTLLGAVRNGASIPWDDDLDIGFLRKDFDRFRKVCDEELGDRFVHTCYYNGTGSHYMVDKIRLRDTYFSTCYSSIHAVEDGVFIDCLVYDATFENKVLAKIHDKVCAFMGNLVQAYWREYRRDEVKTSVRWLVIKMMELLPIGFWHRLYSWAISFCKSKQTPTCLIDSMGKHIGQGTIPFEGLDDVKRVPFDDGFSAPIPRDPTGYLIYDYGTGYLPPPPICKQIAPHNFARIDLGKYLYEQEYDKVFRAVDLRGELFEKEVSRV